MHNISEHKCSGHSKIRIFNLIIKDIERVISLMLTQANSPLGVLIIQMFYLVCTLQSNEDKFCCLKNEQKFNLNLLVNQPTS